ncbi:hypothetical protein SLEP1_g50413 [Rubroshorea leprosula]|uniref:Uncharacterized protein n=1 Tax=Rubroshorea leprosula TaxID=152421 RepID=A0AAV5LZY5_9ROSI|nr:hypothetical protein SLEP1_g50413 [Rubroshorea leprosula]
MSSKGTGSIVGSEVMPLDYGSMDSESSPSPSSSEKTVEGVRGDEVIEVGGEEVVEVGGDSIPITVVEVEGRGERDYDVNAKIVEEVKQYRFELRTRDSLGHLVENYEISSRVLVRPAGVEERPCSAPQDHWMPIYSHYLIAGLRFPIPELLVGPSSIKGWKEKFFFVDDMEWERGDAEVRELASWKAKKANQNRFNLNEDKEEEVRKLVRKGGDLLNIMDLTSAQCIEAAELYGPSALSEAEMDQFLNTAGEVAILKKPRKKSKTSTKQVDEGRAKKEKKKVVEEEGRGNEVPQFVPQPPPIKLDPELRQLEEGVEVRAPEPSTGARWFINRTFPEVDKRNARDEALRYGGASVVKHVLKSASWKEKEELEKKNKELQESLNEVVPTVKQLEQERASLSTKLVFEESKRRISKSEREAQAQEIKLMKEAFVELKENVQTLVHNGMKEHINNFISSSSLQEEGKAEYPEVDITKITFEEQEEGVEEDGESMSADFRPQIKLRWEHDANGRAVFPPQFDFEFVVVEEEGAEVEEDEVEAGVEGTEVDESQPVPEVEIHPVPSEDEQPPLPDEQQPT